MKYLLAALLALCSAAHAAGPTHLILHTVSAHTKPGYNNVNPGVGLRWADAQGDGPVAGVYHNSERNTSVYAGYAWSWHVAGPVSAELTVGGVGGYKRAAVAPMLLPSVTYAITPKVAVRLSGAPPIRDIPGFAHVSFEYKF